MLLHRTFGCDVWKCPRRVQQLAPRLEELPHHRTRLRELRGMVGGLPERALVREQHLEPLALERARVAVARDAGFEELEPAFEPNAQGLRHRCQCSIGKSVSAAEQKKAAGFAAVDRYVKSGMKLGLGTGSTTTFAIERIGEKLNSGALSGITGVSTSERTTFHAKSLGIPVRTLAELPQLDVAIDGADEVAHVGRAFFLTKGLGGALLREKDVARHAKQFVIIVDSSKLVAKLGTKAPTPVEVARGVESAVSARLAALGGKPVLRAGPFVTDHGNFIVDVHWPNGIDDAPALAAKLDAMDGVKAHGLFLGMASVVLVASDDGVQTLEP
jgi:ribose 5-phosphate isomerase A